MDESQNIEFNTELVPESVSSGDADPFSDTPGEAAIDISGILAALREQQETQSFIFDELSEQQETETLILAQTEKISSQLEAAVSVLLLFAVVILLNYIYKFLKMFF